MGYRFFLWLILIAETASAQKDPLSYRVVMNDGLSFSCRIMHEKPGKAILVVKEDNSQELIMWKDIESIYIADSANGKTNVKDLSASERKALKKLELSKFEHSRWDSCFVVKLSGDTIYGRVVPRSDYATTGNNDLTGIRYVATEEFWTEGTIRLSHPDNTEDRFSVSDISELYIYNRPQEFKKFISYGSSPDYKNLYRVIVDGSCQLVYKEIKSTANGIQDLNQERYLVIYKNEITPMRTENMSFPGFAGPVNISIGFREKCRRIFSACPALVEQIENKTFRSDDLREIVREFNQCIAAK